MSISRHDQIDGSDIREFTINSADSVSISYVYIERVHSSAESHSIKIISFMPSLLMSK